METIIVGVAALVGGFVFGVLFGRRNTAKVEADIAAIKAEVTKLSGGKVNI